MRPLLLITLLACGLAMPAAAQPAPVEIELTDLKLDITTMKGKVVRVAGLLQSIGQMVVLKSGPMDMTPIWVNAAHLSRDDRKSLLTTCTVMCKATVIGKVGDAALGGMGLDAIRLENVIGVNAALF